MSFFIFKTTISMQDMLYILILGYHQISQFLGTIYY